MDLYLLGSIASIISCLILLSLVLIVGLILILIYQKNKEFKKRIGVFKEWLKK